MKKGQVPYYFTGPAGTLSSPLVPAALQQL
jgi:hypothetical protein